MKSKNLSREDLISAPYGVGTYLLLEEYLLETGDEECFEKIIRDYGAELPAFKIADLIQTVYWKNNQPTFQKALDCLFGNVHNSIHYAFVERERAM